MEFNQVYVSGLTDSISKKYPSVASTPIPDTGNPAIFPLLRQPFIISLECDYLAFAEAGGVLPGLPHFLAVSELDGTVMVCDEHSCIEFANTSLGQFSEAMVLFLAGLPYEMSDLPEHEFDTVNAAEENLRRELTRIDPKSIDLDTFWDDVLNAISDCDWDAEAIDRVARSYPPR